MQNFSGFLNVFFSSQYFTVIIAVLIMILLLVLSFLIKSQRAQIRELQEANKNRIPIKSIESEQIKVDPKINNVKEKSEVVSHQNERKIIEPTDNLKENPKVELINQNLIKEDITYINPIEEYEKNEEEHAVISTTELEAIEKERDEILGKESNAKLIEEYEETQEKKAIISYNELLKNASTLELNYIEKPKEEADAPLIKQVEVKEVSFKAVSYAAEEEYLKILKEFRMGLTNG